MLVRDAYHPGMLNQMQDCAAALGGVPELSLRNLGILGPVSAGLRCTVPIGEGVSVLWRARAVAD